jgi:hypothetical protein
LPFINFLWIFIFNNIKYRQSVIKLLRTNFIFLRINFNKLWLFKDVDVW